MLSFFFFNDTATTEIYTLSLHDALPIFDGRPGRSDEGHLERDRRRDAVVRTPARAREGLDRRGPDRDLGGRRRVVRDRHEADELAVRSARMDDVLDAREDRKVLVAEHVHGHAQDRS